MRELTQRWFHYIERFSPRTQEQYKMAMLRFLDFCPKYAKNVNIEHIERYIDTVLKTCSKRTSNNYLIACKSFFRWASEHYDLPNPAAKVKLLKCAPPKGRFLSHEEYLIVLSVCKDDGEAEVIKFIANTGLRLTEARELAWGNISPDMRFISLNGKGQKHRLIPLNKTCQQILSKYKSYPDIKFLESYRSRPALYRLCCRLATRCGIPKFGVHALRHYGATRLMQKGVPIAKISRILGHASISTTERIYIHWLPDDLVGVTDCLD